jgi:hypothetical protein
MKNLDLNHSHPTGLSKGDVVDSTAAHKISEDITNMLDQVFDLIFTSSKHVLGNIHSIGIKYGHSLDNPDHMVIIFPHEVHGFESWNQSSKRKRWRYQRSTKTIMKNGSLVTDKDTQSFVQFILKGLAAINDQQVAFSKNITQKELQDVR